MVVRSTGLPTVVHPARPVEPVIRTEALARAEQAPLDGFAPHVQAPRPIQRLSPADAAKEPPALVGVIEVRGESVVLRGAGGTLELVNQGSWCWGSDVSAFHGATVTVKGWPDGAGRLVVEEFAPGSSADFVHGRVEVSTDGRVGLRVRADKWVELSNPELAAALRSYGGDAERPGTGLILPGAVEAVTTPAGPRWTFAGNPEGYYLLTTLRERAADDGATFDAEVAHGRRLALTSTAPLRADFPASRRFAFGAVRGERSFAASWVSPPSWLAVWGAPRGEPTPTQANRALAAAFSQSPQGLVSFSPPRALPEQPPIVYRDRAVLQELSKAAVFFIAGGAKLHIPDPQEFAAMGLTAASIRRVAERTLSHVADVPVDGTLVRERGTAGVFVFDGGTRRHVPNPERFAQLGFQWAQVIDVPRGSLERFPTGAPA